VLWRALTPTNERTPYANAKRALPERRALPPVTKAARPAPRGSLTQMALRPNVVGARHLQNKFMQLGSCNFASRPFSVVVRKCRQPPFTSARKSTDFDLRTKFATKSFGEVVEKQADFGRKVPAFRMDDVNGRGRWFVVEEDGLESSFGRVGPA